MSKTKASAITKEASITAKNLSTVAFLKVAQYPFLALFMMLVPRMMGPEIYGEYALLMSIIVIAASLVGFGFDALTRFIPEFEVRGESTNTKKLPSNTLTLKIAVDLIASVILFSILYFVYGDRFPITYFLLIIATMLVADWGGVPYNLLFGLNKLGKYTLREPLTKILSLTFLLVSFHYYGLLGAIASILLVQASLTTLYFFWTREYFRIRDFGVDLHFLKPYLMFDFVFYISWGLLNLWQRLNNTLIEYITKDLKEIAFFDISNQIFLVISAFILFAINSLTPIFTGLVLTGKEEKLIKWSRLIIKYTGILGMIFFWAFILTGPNLIPIIIGPDYKEIFPNGVVLLLGIFPMIFAQLGFVFSVVYKKPRRYFQSLCFAFATFLVISILLIPKYASLGCSIATFISCIVLAVGMCVYFREKLLPCLTDGFKVIALGFVFVPFLFFRGSLITNLFLVVCSVLIYTLFLFGSRILSLREIKQIYWAIRHQAGERASV